MQIATILRAIEDTLKPLEELAGGIVHVMDTEVDAIEALLVAPGKYSVFLTADGTDGTEAQDTGGWCEGRVSVWMNAPKGLAADKSAAIHRVGVNGTPSFLARLENTITRMRGLVFEDEAIDGHFRFLKFRKWEWVKIEGVTIRAAKATFEITYALDEPGSVDASELTAPPRGYLVPPGGEVGQIPAKASGANGDITWTNPPAGGDPNAVIGAGISLAIVGAFLHVTKNGVTRRVPLSQIPA